MFKALKMFTYDGKTYQLGDLIEKVPARLVNLGMAVEIVEKAQEVQTLTEDVKPVENVLVEDSSAVEVVKEDVQVKPLKKTKKK